MGCNCWPVKPSSNWIRFCLNHESVSVSACVLLCCHRSYTYFSTLPTAVRRLFSPVSAETDSGVVGVQQQQQQLRLSRPSNGGSSIVINRLCKNCSTADDDDVSGLGSTVIQCRANNSHGSVFANGYINVLGISHTISDTRQ